jgi:hypothetical protein
MDRGKGVLAGAARPTGGHASQVSVCHQMSAEKGPAGRRPGSGFQGAPGSKLAPGSWQGQEEAKGPEKAHAATGDGVPDHAIFRGSK